MKKGLLLLLSILSTCAAAQQLDANNKTDKRVLEKDIVQTITNYYYFSFIVGHHPFSKLDVASSDAMLFKYCYIDQNKNKHNAIEVLQYDFIEGDITHDALKDMLVLVTYQEPDSLRKRDLFVFLNNKSTLGLANVIKVNSIDTDISTVKFGSINKGKITLLTQKQALLKVDVAPEEQKEILNYEYELNYLLDPKEKGAGNFVISAKRIME